ncbi:MAG TPA: helix-turn-helix transcriptional regulator [Clostridia bacterium]
MDIVKIGKFIAELRNLKGITQKELASSIMVSDKAVSKWENGKGLPDPSSWLALCDVLGISVNEMLLGMKYDIPITPAISDKTLVDSTLLFRKKANKRSLILLFVSLAFTFIFTVSIILFTNLTFFSDSFNMEISEGKQISIPVPKNSFYRRTGGMYIVIFKTLREPDEVNIFIDRYKSSLYKTERDGAMLYYDSVNDITL